MTFTLSGFKEGDGFRRFTFQCVAADRSMTTVTVRADVSLARKHEIRLQELPLLCLRLLQSLDEKAPVVPIILTEAHMIAIQMEARAAGEKKARKQSARPYSGAAANAINSLQRQS